MTLLLFTSFALITLSLSLLLINKTMTPFNFLDREMTTPFECGFDPLKSARFPFSLQFFIITLIFLIFDVEIVLLLPIPLSMPYTNPLTFLPVAIGFIILLLIGLIYEWKRGALSWLY